MKAGPDREISFGTDGIRGKFGELPITSDVAFAVGYSVAKMGGKGVIISRDTRPSGPDLEIAVTSGVLSAGGRALITGVLPTSGMAAALKDNLGDIGIMITASHNPADDNGFKILGSGGKKLSPEDESGLQTLINETLSKISVLKKITPSGTSEDISKIAKASYESAMLSAFGDLSNLAGKKVAIDLANGAGIIIRDFLERTLPCQIFFVNTTSKINEGCGSENTSLLQTLVINKFCDAGIAIDGDGDRCLLINQFGVPVTGDALAHGLIRAGSHKKVAITVMSNAAIESSLPEVNFIRTDVGDRNLLQEIVNGNATIGCEESGHVVFSDALPTGDGLVTGIRAISASFNSGNVLDYFGVFKPFPRRIGKIPYSKKIEIPSFNADELGKGGRIFVRYSGTEPVLRLLVEGEDETSVEKTFSEVTSNLKDLFENQKKI
jgi:phosphoglucosamine mutase